MDDRVKATMRECSRISDQGAKPFSEVVAMLMSVGVERYHADLVRSEKTYHLPNGESETIANDRVGVTPCLLYTSPSPRD